MGEQLLVEFFKTCGPNLNHINIPGMKHILLPNLFRALKEANAIVTSTLDLRFEQIQEDNDISSIIGLSTTWSEIYLSDQGYASALTARAIAANGQDLQELDIIGCPRIDSANLQQILCHTFQLKRLHAGCTIAPHMLGNPFLCASDVAASSWVCLDLQEFVVNIEGVPRPDLKTGHDTPRLRRLLDEGTIEESHAIQRRVLRQLGALKSLKRLCLGHPLVQYKRHIYQAQSEFLRLQDFYYQVSCLEMSLDSGLDQLVELKDLEELHVTGMAHRIGVDELEWMLLHWPKLKRLAGLFHSQHKILEPNVAVWLQERRPVWAEEYLVKDYFTDESRTLRRQKF
ncbi:hypothetical protein BGZ94_006605 [Podila epigama]|nr:hypothetical protein BGZ94_006605 [Podila epigama]